MRRTESARQKLREAVALHRRGDLVQAERIYSEILRDRPDDAEVLHLLGVVALHTARHERAVALISRSVTFNKNIAAAHRSLGDALSALGRHAEAVAAYERALALEPENPQTHFNRGNSLGELGQYSEALVSYDKAIALKPDFAAAFLNRGFTLAALRRYEDALADYDRAIALNPQSAGLHHNRGLVLLELRRPQAAQASFECALTLDPRHAGAHVGRGTALMEFGHAEEAILSFDRALALKPAMTGALVNRGNALRVVSRFDEALANYDRAISLDQHDATLHYDRGLVLMDLRRPSDALLAYDFAISLNPDYADAHNNRGLACMALNRPEQALASYDIAIALRSDLAEAHSNRGNVLTIFQRLAEASARHDGDSELRPDDAASKLDEALASYERAIRINPDLPGVEGDRLYTRLRVCDWTDFDRDRAHLISSIRAGKANAHPFALVAIPSSVEDQFQCASQWMSRSHPTTAMPPRAAKPAGAGRIRVAYLSADFRDHPVAHLIAGLIEKHDRSRFEITGVSFGVDDSSAMRKRLVSAFDRFCDVQRSSDSEIAKLVSELDVDIAVDITGHTRSGRLGVYGHRPAPIQVNYLGYPGTIGSNSFDYIIADPVTAPFAHACGYSEKIVHLPDSYQANDDSRETIGPSPPRSESGLPENAFVFCCFNNNYKITPGIFDAWMRILARVDGSVLWLLQDSVAAAANLRREAALRRIDPTRLIFARRIPRPEHFARHRCANLFLDTLPYNAHTTASDALWAGLPMVTCRGETFAGRVGASLLHAVGVPELVAENLADYERLAVALTLDATRLAAIKAKLASNRATAPLFDTDRFARNIETAYATMVRRHDAGLAPDHIVVRG